MSKQEKYSNYKKNKKDFKNKLKNEQRKKIFHTDEDTYNNNELPSGAFDLKNNEINEKEKITEKYDENEKNDGDDMIEKNKKEETQEIDYEIIEEEEFNDDYFKPVIYIKNKK
jgi:hypothetical protein